MSDPHDGQMALVRLRYPIAFGVIGYKGEIDFKDNRGIILRDASSATSDRIATSGLMPFVFIPADMIGAIEHLRR
jgi:hypothetical protein